MKKYKKIVHILLIIIFIIHTIPPQLSADSFLTPPGATEIGTSFFIDEHLKPPVLNLIAKGKKPNYEDIMKEIDPSVPKINKNQVMGAVRALGLKKYTTRVINDEERIAQIKKVTVELKDQLKRLPTTHELLNRYNQKHPSSPLNQERFGRWRRNRNISHETLGMREPAPSYPSIRDFKKTVNKIRKGKHKEFLVPSELCDCDNEIVLRVAYKLTKTLDSPGQKADKLWNYIKAQMYFGIGLGGYWDAKASETVEELGRKPSDKKYGMSFNWANSLIAMARSIGIPARYSVIQVKKEAYKHLYSSKEYKAMAKTVPYISAELYIEGKWKKFDIYRDHKRFDVLEKAYTAAEIDAFALSLAKGKSRSIFDAEEKNRQASIIKKQGRKTIPLAQIERGNIILKVIADLTEQKKPILSEDVKKGIARLAQEEPLVKTLNTTQMNLTIDYWGIKHLLVMRRPHYENLISKIKKITSKYEKEKGKKPTAIRTCLLFKEKYPDQAFNYNSFVRWLKAKNRYESLGIAEPTKGIGFFVGQITSQLQTQREKEHGEYLMPSRVCNCDDLDIISRAVELTKKTKSKSKKAYILWEWIKKSMFFGEGYGGYWDASASETFKNVINRAPKNRCGMSFNWANLLITMARSIGIPARYTIVQVKKEAFKHLYSPEQFEKLEDNLTHVSAELFLEGQWKKFDIFRDHQFDISTTQDTVSNIDTLAIHNAEKKTRKSCDDIEKKRRAYMHEQGALENISVLWLERGTIVRKIIADLNKQKIKWTVENIAQELTRQAQKDSAIEKISINQVRSVVKVNGLSSLFGKKITWEERKARIIQMIEEFKGKQENKGNKGPLAEKTIELYNKKYPDDSITYDTLLRWMNTNKVTFEDMGIAKVVRGADHSLSLIIEAAKKAAIKNNGGPVTYADIREAMGSKSPAFSNQLRRLRQHNINVEKAIRQAGVTLTIQEPKPVVKPKPKKIDQRQAKQQREAEKKEFAELVKNIEDHLIELEKMKIGKSMIFQNILDLPLVKNMTRLFEKYRHKTTYYGKPRKTRFELRFNSAMKRIKQTIYQNAEAKLEEIKALDLAPEAEVEKISSISYVDAIIAGFVVDGKETEMSKILRKKRNEVIKNKKRELRLIAQIQDNLQKFKEMHVEDVILDTLSFVKSIVRDLGSLEELRTGGIVEKQRIAFEIVLIEKELEILEQTEVTADTKLNSISRIPVIRRRLRVLEKMGAEKDAERLKTRFEEIYNKIKQKIKDLPYKEKDVNSHLDTLKELIITATTDIERLNLVTKIQSMIGDIETQGYAVSAQPLREKLNTVLEQKHNEQRELIQLMQEIEINLTALEKMPINEKTILQNIEKSQLVNDIRTKLQEYREKTRYGKIKKTDLENRLDAVLQKIEQIICQIIESKLEELKTMDIQPDMNINQLTLAECINTLVAGCIINGEKTKRAMRLENKRDAILEKRKKELELIKDIEKKIQDLRELKVSKDTKLMNADIFAVIKQKINELEKSGVKNEAKRLLIEFKVVMIEKELEILDQTEVTADTKLPKIPSFIAVKRWLKNLRDRSEALKQADEFKTRFDTICQRLKEHIIEIKTKGRDKQLKKLKPPVVTPDTVVKKLEIVDKTQVVEPEPEPVVKPEPQPEPELKPVEKTEPEPEPVPKGLMRDEEEQRIKTGISDTIAALKAAKEKYDQRKAKQQRETEEKRAPVKKQRPIALIKSIEPKKPKEVLPYAGLLQPGEEWELIDQYRMLYPDLKNIVLLKKIIAQKNWAFLSAFIVRIESAKGSLLSEQEKMMLEQAKETLREASKQEEASGVSEIPLALKKYRKNLPDFNIERAQDLLNFEFSDDGKIHMAEQEELEFAYEYLNKYLFQIIAHDRSLGIKAKGLFKHLGILLGRSITQKLPLIDKTTQRNISTSK